MNTPLADDDAIIDAILNKMADNKLHVTEATIKKIYPSFTDSECRVLRDKMLRKKLIKVSQLHFDQISDFGLEVLEAGGWLAYSTKSKSNEQLRLSQLALDVENLKSQRPRFWITTIVAIIAIGVAAYDVYLDGRVDELDSKLTKQQLQIDKLSMTQDSHSNLLGKKDKEIKANALKIDSLVKTLHQEVKDKKAKK